MRSCYRCWHISFSCYKRFYCSEAAEVDKLDIDKLTDVPNSLNSLKTKVDDLDVG